MERTRIRRPGAGSPGPRAGGALRRVHRRAPRGRHQLRHHRAASGPDGPGRGRRGRGRHRALHLHRQRDGDPLRRRPSGVRGRRGRYLQHGSGPDRGGDHPAHEGDHAGQPLRAARRPAGDHGHRRAPRARGARGRRPEPRRGHRRSPQRLMGRGCVQLLPDQEHDHRRGRHDHHLRRRGRGARPAAAGARDEGALPPRHRRVQLPHVGHPRQHWPGAAAEAPGQQRAAPGDRSTLRRGSARRHHARGALGGDPRLPPVHDPREPTRRVRRAAPRTWRGYRHLLPDPGPSPEAVRGARVRRPAVPGHRDAGGAGGQHPRAPRALRRRRRRRDRRGEPDGGGAGADRGRDGETA